MVWKRKTKIKRKEKKATLLINDRCEGSDAQTKSKQSFCRLYNQALVLSRISKLCSGQPEINEISMQIQHLLVIQTPHLGLLWLCTNIAWKCSDVKKTLVRKKLEI